MRKFLSLQKLFVFGSIFLIAGFSLASFLPSDNMLTTKQLVRSIIRCVEDGPRPPGCPPDTTLFLTSTLRDTTVPVRDGFRVTRVITISNDTTVISFQIFIEKVLPGNFLSPLNLPAKK